jgi:hypothetical protein
VQLESTVAGIPCVIKVDGIDYQPPFRGSPWQCDSDVDYYGGWEFNWVVCDQRGRPAPWLERKLTSAEEDRINQLIIRSLEDNHDQL